VRVTATATAAGILAALDGAPPVPLPSAEDPELSEDGAYALARELHDLRLARGERPVGRKIGFTNRALWAEFGVAAPIWGHVYASTLREAPDGRATVAVGALHAPRIEPEVQLHFARTPPADGDAETILACVEHVSLGFELAHSPYAGWTFTAADAIAGGGLHGLLVIGPRVPVAAVDDPLRRLASFTLDLLRDGEVVSSGGGASVLDSPLLAFAHLAGLLAAQDRFPPVQAGEIVTTGSLTGAPVAAAGETWSTRVAGIPLPDIELVLERAS
jgi:2-oxo-3-hexenedioate decarboxylase